MPWLIERRVAALLLDPGLGKTSITLCACRGLKREDLFRGALVIAPLRPATTTWPEEAAYWEQFQELSVAVLHGQHKDKLVEQRHDIYVVNYEGLPWLVKGGHLARLLKDGWIDTLVFDELSKMKNPDTRMVRYASLAPYLHRFERRWGLTGSPAAEGLEYLFAQIRVLDLGKRLGRFVTHFRNLFMFSIGQWDWGLKAGAADAIYAAISDIALRMDATDYMELPEVKNVMISVELPPAARKIYDQMEDELIALLEGERVTAATAGVMSGKCRQIASGALYKSSTDPVTGETIRGQREWFDIHDAKLDALADLVDELQGTQLLVAYEYEHDLVRLQKRFPGTPYLGSGVSTKEAARIEREWNSGKLRLLFGHPASMGHGLNFQHSHAHHVAWFTTTWSFEQYEQFNARLRRRGNQSAHLFVYHLVARRTIEDGVVIPGLRAKEKGQRALFDALKAYAAARKA